jgi:DhnA family fructose-bisphosphate aldolase class Ia
MVNPGKELRLGKIFAKDKKTLIVPLDHGIVSGPVKGLEFPRKTIDELKKGGADAFIVTYGMIRNFYKCFEGYGVILRMDGGPSDYANDMEATDLMCTVEDALRIGADAVITSTWLGGPHEARTVASAMRLAAQCDAWGMPLIIETFVSSEIDLTVESVSMAARIGCELGADAIKTYLVGDATEYRKVTESCYCPVVVLGGEKADDELLVLKWTKTAIEAGAAGTSIGRNVFQHKNPQGVTKAMRAIIHENASVEHAAQFIK